MYVFCMLLQLHTFQLIVDKGPFKSYQEPSLSRLLPHYCFIKRTLQTLSEEKVLSPAHFVTQFKKKFHYSCVSIKCQLLVASVVHIFPLFNRYRNFFSFSLEHFFCRGTIWTHHHHPNVVTIEPKSVTKVAQTCFV